MDGPCSMHQGIKTAYTFFIGELQRRIPLEVQIVRGRMILN
jgi:hypothetical protein